MASLGLEFRNARCPEWNGRGAFAICSARGGRRRSPAELGDWIDVDEEVVPPWPERVLVVDDVVCAGGHFVAARRALEARFPGVRVAGVFVARVVREGVTSSAV